MTEIRLIPAIIHLKRTPAEKILLAHICQRTVATGGCCPDSNGELAQAVGMHPQTVSDLVNRLSQAQLVLPASDSEQLSKRVLIPAPELLEAYQQSTPPTDQAITPTPVKEQLDRPQRLCPITGIDITHQRADMKLVSRQTLRRILRSDPRALDEVFARFLTPAQIREGGLDYRLAKQVRKLYEQLLNETPA